MSETLALVQPFGLNSPGGGPRILRALLQDSPRKFVSICSGPVRAPASKIGEELHIPLRPYFGRIERTRFGKYLHWEGPLFSARYKRRLEDTLRERQVSAVHAIPQGMQFWYAFEVARRMGVPYYLNVHDDLTYNLAGTPYLPKAMDRLGRVWAGATGRMVISEAMGEEYCRRYGRQSYTIVTDGLDRIPATSRPRPPQSLRIYFMGAIHYSYFANFRGLQAALNLLHTADPTRAISLTCRGGPPPGVETTYAVTVLPWATEAEVAEDFEGADLLYLPLPFEQKYDSFCRFSMSTKMISYLGSGLPILYHGPVDAAAGRLLASAGAALPITSPEPERIKDALGARANLCGYAESGLALGREQFRLADQRRKFWSVVSGGTDH